MASSTSIRITIPKKNEQTEPPSVRRKTASLKRRAILSDEEDNDQYDRPVRIQPPHKKSRRSPSETTPVPKGDRMDVDEGESEVDVDGDDNMDTRFLPDSRSKSKHTTPSTSLRTSRPPATRKKSREYETSSGRISRKKRAIYSSDSGEDESVNDDDDIVVVRSSRQSKYDQDDDFVPGASSPRGSKEKEKERSVSKGKGKDLKSGYKGARKEKEKEKEIAFKDERQTGSLPKRQKSTAKEKEEEALPSSKGKEKDNTPPTSIRPLAADDTASTSTPVPTPVPTSSLPPIPKKNKLPPIKKNKPANAGSAGSTPNPLKKTGEKVPPGQEKEKNGNETIVPAVVKKPPPKVAADLNLMNKDVYAELFKSAGGSTPRSGLVRKERESERRAELNKMRDEARAKRLADAKSSFDLQAAPEKIARFEDSLRDKRSSALFPNILAGKLREIWEKNQVAARRKERERPENWER